MAIAPIKVCYLAFSLKQGGAAVAAKRIIDSVSKHGVETSCYIADSKQSFLFKVKRIISHLLGRAVGERDIGKLSLNLFSCPEASNLLLKKNEIVHCHWINNDTISIVNLATLLEKNKSIVTLHDEWLYCGKEHYPFERYSQYQKRPNSFSFFFSDQNTFKRKVKALESLDFTITVPSNWMKERVKGSYLGKGKRVEVIGNPIPFDIFTPSEPQKLTRENLGIPDNHTVILFGAIGGGSYIKGSDLLMSALLELGFILSKEQASEITLLAFGGDIGDTSELKTFHIVETGHISTPELMADLYRLSNVTVVPSRVEAFGQVAAESCACGTPVIAFRYSGITDIIKDGYNGFLSEPFSPKSLANNIAKFINLNESEVRDLQKNGTIYINKQFHPEKIAMDFIKLYQNI
ncbi:glycosyltransferase [Pseudoalteromonas piscicida]|uniref:glycosyltransferase n=1 Tax=Pseudoalteromonas piscicida TaxID=43662 RepID=UPI0030C95380